MEDIRRNISKNLLYYRKQNNLTQTDLARLLGVSNSAVSNWENGFNSIDIETLFRTCRIFGVTLDDMYGTHEKKPFYTPHEQKIIEEYRNRPRLQEAVDILLGLRKEPSVN